MVDLGWVDFDLDVPSSCLALEPILPTFQLPKQNGAGSGMPQFKVNPTLVYDHLPNPVNMNCAAQALSLFLVLMVLQEILLEGERVAFTNNPDTWVYRASLHHL